MELISHYQPEEFRKGQKETPHIWPPPRILLAGIHLGWTRHAPPGRSESEWLATDNPETNPITITPETASHVTELLSWVPLPSCSPPGCPFPVKSLALSAHVSPRIIHFRGLDKSPVLGPGRGPPSCYIVTAQTLSTFGIICYQKPGARFPQNELFCGKKIRVWGIKLMPGTLLPSTPL